MDATILNRKLNALGTLGLLVLTGITMLQGAAAIEPLPDAPQVAVAPLSPEAQKILATLPPDALARIAQALADYLPFPPTSSREQSPDDPEPSSGGPIDEILNIVCRILNEPDGCFGFGVIMDFYPGEPQQIYCPLFGAECRIPINWQGPDQGLDPRNWNGVPAIVAGSYVVGYTT